MTTRGKVHDALQKKGVDFTGERKEREREKEKETCFFAFSIVDSYAFAE